ncbi:hypothetical protein BJX61DRAFT_546176 [Aspergillus egyptiacus]|nr:hypothetical protein BJX61DRAFT_546176 [Aspergillus egyptiacus]
MDPIPPASRNGFEYYNHDFYVTVPPDHRHRRCTVSEIGDLLNGRGSVSINDKPAHWYRAQLLHYGLQPTSQKGTAVIRLMDAFRRRELEVPEHLRKLEADLKEWNRMASERRKQARKNESKSAHNSIRGQSSGRKSNQATAVKGKRKRDPELDVVGRRSGFTAAASAAGSDKQHYSSQPRQTLSLGLLNGSYKIDSQAVNTRNSGMILCLDGTSIWGEFQLGNMEGVFFMMERPWGVSYTDSGGCPFIWRGVDQSTGLIYSGPEFQGVMRFLGNGNVDGTFYCVVPDVDVGELFDCDFWGHRTSAPNETRAARDAYSMRAEFEELAFI